LNNLPIKFTVILLILSIFSIGCAKSKSEESAQACVERILHANVVRIDTSNKRFFIASQDITATDIKEKLPQLEECFLSREWNSDWSLSGFTDAKYAGYKDEADIIPYHKDNTWAKAYVFEYDHATNSLVKNPATNPEQILP